MRKIIPSSLACAILFLTSCTKPQDVITVAETTRSTEPSALLGATLSVKIPASANWGVAFEVPVVTTPNTNVIVSLTSSSKGKLTGTTTKKTDANGNTTFKLSVIDKDNVTKVSDEGIGVHTLSFSSNATTKTGTINIKIPAGYSSSTKFRYKLSSNQLKILSTANSFVGSSPYSLAPTPDDMWFTDCIGKDGEKLSDAYGIYRTYRLANVKNPEIPANSSTTRTDLWNTLSTYQNGSDFNTIVSKMAAIYKANPNAKAPNKTKDQDVLSFYGIRAQCKETKDRITKSAISKQFIYGGGVTKTDADVRAGMIFEWATNKHTGIILDTYFDSDGKLTKIKVIESNYKGDFKNPEGQIPWDRTVTNSREVTLPDTKYRFADY